MLEKKCQKIVMNNNEPIDEQYKIARYEDQFSLLTRSVRRNLLVVSSILIALTTEGIRFKSLFGIDIENSLSSKLVTGAISLIVLYELITFFVYALIDHRMWLSKQDIIISSYSYESIKNVVEILEPINISTNNESLFGPRIDLVDSNGDLYTNQINGLKSVIEDARNAINQYNNKLEKLRISIEITNYIQLCRIYLLDWAIPILISVLSLYRSYESVCIFVVQLI
jgi:hypothetical protein